MTTEPDYENASPSSGIDLSWLEYKNKLRQAAKSSVPDGPWYVKTNVYRGLGPRYEVRKRLDPLSKEEDPDDPVVLCDGLDKTNKEFVVFFRNDDAEADVALLINRIRELATFETHLSALENRIADLTEKNNQAEARIKHLEAEKLGVEAQLQAYQKKTAHIHSLSAYLQQALSFYADEKNWEWQLVSNKVIKDEGQVAREALQALANEDFIPQAPSVIPEKESTQRSTGGFAFVPSLTVNEDPPRNVLAQSPRSLFKLLR